MILWRAKKPHGRARGPDCVQRRAGGGFPVKRESGLLVVRAGDKSASLRRSLRRGCGPEASGLTLQVGSRAANGTGQRAGGGKLRSQESKGQKSNIWRLKKLALLLLLSVPRSLGPAASGRKFKTQAARRGQSGAHVMFIKI